jgi:23S rRNA (guanine1835-N2)-methyltransferase
MTNFAAQLLYCSASFMTFSYQDRAYKIKRYPATTQTSLQAWSAADEYLLKYCIEQNADPVGPIAIYDDRFGFLAVLLHAHQPVSVISAKSQEKAIRLNLKANKLDGETVKWADPLTPMAQPVALGLIRVPKSMDLFRFYLAQVTQALSADGQVVCAFMTRHFSAQMLEVAATYFESVEQSLAWKKSRLLILKGPKQVEPKPMLTTVQLSKDHTLQQYPGVFSANKVDPASRMLMEQLRISYSARRVLDVGTGNGVLAAAIHALHPDIEMHVLDDSFLAIESARLNLDPARTHFHFNNSLETLESDFFDLVVSNPPFHFEHENNIEISLHLFEEVVRCLKEGGHFQLVGNRHLNYKVHLARQFRMVKILAETPKFVVYQCTK